MGILKRVKKAKENKKGFTLVELIVVIVILTILAAILVPALLGWIDKAKEKQVVLNASSLYKAAQARASEKYAHAKSPSAKCTFDDDDKKIILATSDLQGGDVKAEVYFGDGASDKHKYYTIEAMSYQEKGTDPVYMKDGEGSWDSVKPSPFPTSNPQVIGSYSTDAQGGDGANK